MGEGRLVSRAGRLGRVRSASRREMAPRGGSPLVPRRGLLHAMVLLTGSSGGVGHSARPALEAGGWAVEPFDLPTARTSATRPRPFTQRKAARRWCTLEASLMPPPAPPHRSWQLTLWARGTFCKPPKAARSPVSAAPSRVQPRWGAYPDVPGPRFVQGIRAAQDGRTRACRRIRPRGRRRGCRCVLSSCRRRSESDPLRSRPERHRR
jgi:hypothetical protein